MKLRTRISITAIATAAAVGTTGAVLLPAASAKTITHTTTFTSLRQTNVTFSPTAGGEVDKDVNKAGKLVGWDLVRITIDPKTQKIAGGFTLMTKGGFLYGTVSPANGTTHGKLTGGTGSFRGATGTILVKDLNKSGSKSAITITWHN
jgi:hypothetical protein